MKKVIRIGHLKHEGNVFCKIEIKDGNLSISGVIKPMPNGGANSSGQIIASFKEWDARGYLTLDDFDEFAPGWDKTKARHFFGVWDEWHLNDVRPGCKHQKGWNDLPIDPEQPTTAYGKFFPGQKSDSWNMLGWVREDEHPDGLLCKPCPVCGYKYGTAWLREELPDEVIEFLEALPNADHKPYWV